MVVLPPKCTFGGHLARFHSQCEFCRFLETKRRKLNYSHLPQWYKLLFVLRGWCLCGCSTVCTCRTSSAVAISLPL